MLIAYYPGQPRKHSNSVIPSHDIAMKLILTSLLYLSCLKKYSAIVLIKSLHSDSFSYHPDWNFTPWSFPSSIFKIGKGTSLNSDVMCYIVKFDQCFSLFFGHFFKTWACRWICRHFMNYLFGTCRATSGVGLFSWFFSFTVRFCPSIATWSDKVEDLKLAVPSIKVMFVWGISFSFCSCDLKIVKIIFCHSLNLLPKARETFFFICWLSSLLGLFCPFQFRQYWFQLSKGKRKFTTTF